MGSPTILIADDDPEMRDLVEIILRDAGMQAIFAENGSQLLDLWRRHPVDILVLDVMMPVMDGLEACKRIRRISDIPIIFLTAKGQEQDVVNGLETGADDYIVKPFRAAEFVARIKVILNRTARQKDACGKRLSFDKLILDLESRRVISRGRSIEVTPLEFQLLRYLRWVP